MNYELSDAHKSLQAEMAKFCREEIAPEAALFDTASPQEAVVGMRANLTKIADAGFMKLLLGDDLLGICIAGEELSRACPSTFLSTLSSATAFGRAIRCFGADGQKNRYIPLLTAGKSVGALACTEKAAGSDLGGIQSLAERRDGGWFLNGEKDLVTNAPLADHFLFLAWTDRDGGLEKGLSYFLIDRGAKGMTVGRPVETMGLRGAPVASITLENCVVSDAELLGGAIGEGWRQTRAVMEELRIAISSLCVGIGVACMEESTRNAKTKKAFGKPIGLFEGVGAKLAMMFTLNDIGRMMTCRAAWAMERSDPEGPVLASCAKLFTSEAARKIADMAMQVHGGHGYLKGAAVERLYRDARFAELAWGTSEMQRSLIAKDSLDRFRAA